MKHSRYPFTPPKLEPTPRTYIVTLRSIDQPFGATCLQSDSDFYISAFEDDSPLRDAGIPVHCKLLSMGPVKTITSLEEDLQRVRAAGSLQFPVTVQHAIPGTGGSWPGTGNLVDESPSQYEDPTTGSSSFHGTEGDDGGYNSDEDESLHQPVTRLSRTSSRNSAESKKSRQQQRQSFVIPSVPMLSSVPISSAQTTAEPRRSWRPRVAGPYPTAWGIPDDPPLKQPPSRESRMPSPVRSKKVVLVNLRESSNSELRQALVHLGKVLEGRLAVVERNHKRMIDALDKADTEARETFGCGLNTLLQRAKERKEINDWASQKMAHLKQQMLLSSHAL